MNSGNLRLTKHRFFALAFERHIEAFIKEYRLFERDDNIFLALSGGVDSMALAHVLVKLSLEFEIIHFNHGTRPAENALEEKTVKLFAKKWNKKLHLFHGQFKLHDSNFEAKARSWRKEIYTRLAAADGVVLSAHHLNDSYEWSLMQASRQSSLKATLGIPLKAHFMRRPFLCVSKKQILRYARAVNLSWHEDQSNTNVRFERNFIRKNVVSSLEKKYPSLLRHYVAQKNELARLLEQSSGQKSDDQLIITEDPSKGIFLHARDLEGHKEKIKQWIHHFSHKKRGELDREVEKLITAHAQMQNPASRDVIKGPMFFSGGVEILITRDGLFIMGMEQQVFFRALDQQIVSQCKNFTQIPFCVYPHFPSILIGKNALTKKAAHYIHPLLPQTTAWLKHNNVPYTFAPVMTKTLRQNVHHTAVILASS